MTKVLILDDDPTILSILGRQLQLQGADVIACRELEAAEAVLEVFPVHKVITDLCVSALGGLEGTRLIRHLASRYAGLPIFAMSSHIDVRVRDILEALGVADAFEKPFDARRVAEAVLGTERRPPGTLHSIEPLAAFLSSGKLRAMLQPVMALKPSAAPFPVHGIEGFASAPDDCLLKTPALLFGLAARKDKLAQTDLLCARAVLAEARSLGGGTRLFVNVHPGSLFADEFAKSLTEEVVTAGFPPQDVVLELSERHAPVDAMELASKLAPLRKQGFKLSLDNYGDGASNLRVLLALKPDYVKLAGSLTEGIDVDPLQREVVRSTLELLARLGMRAILSRIETPSELAAAVELGVAFGQGWHFCRPMAASEMKRGGFSSGPAQVASGPPRSSPFAQPEAGEA